MPKLDPPMTDYEIRQSFKTPRTWRYIIKDYARSFIPSCKMLYHAWKTRHEEPEKDFMDLEFEEYWQWYDSYYLYWRAKKRLRYAAWLEAHTYFKRRRFFLICHFNNYNRLAHILIKLYWLSLYPTYSFKFFKKARFFKYYGRKLSPKRKQMVTTNQIVFVFDEPPELWLFLYHLEKMKLYSIIYPLCIADSYRNRFVPIVYFYTNRKKDLSEEGYKKLYFEVLFKRIIKNFRVNTALWIDEKLNTPLF